MFIANSAWIEENNIKPYQEYKDQLIKSSKTIAFKDAVNQIEEFIVNPEVGTTASGIENLSQFLTKYHCYLRNLFLIVPSHSIKIQRVSVTPSRCIVI